MKYFLPLCVAASLLSCTKDNAEVAGAHILQQARQELAQQHYDAARDSIMSLRKNFPTAIEARRQAILLLDSVEMLAAQDSLQRADSADWERLDVKAKFFQRKLQEDLKR